MNDHLKSFANHSDYSAVESQLIKPNVSYCVQQNEMHYNPIETRLVTVYNITSTTKPTKILNLADNLTSMEVDGVLQSSVTTGYTFSTTGEHTVKYEINSNWDGYTTFVECTSLTSVTIPDSVTTIGDGVCQDCSGLTSVTIPDNVTSIGRYAFAWCESLTSVTIPDSVTSIGDLAFVTAGLTSVTVKATTPPSLGNNPFNNTNNCPIYVPAESVNAYKTTGDWSTYASRIQAIQ